MVVVGWLERERERERERKRENKMCCCDVFWCVGNGSWKVIGEKRG